jgi:hypothetical protein
MKLIRSTLVVCLALAAGQAYADVTIKMTVATIGGPVPMEFSTVTFIKGMKMRSDVKIMGQDMSMFVDVATKQQLMVNNATKEVQDVGAAMANLPMSFGEATVSVKPNGQTKEVLGRTCAGFTAQITMPMTMMEESIVMTMSGVVWIAKDGTGIAEYQAFTKASAAAGLMSSPVSQGPQAKSLAQMQAAFAENGVPLEQEMQINMTGSGQMAQMMAQSGAGSMTMTMKVTDITVEPIPVEVVTAPGAGVKK